jgi:hypothetical protein
MNIEFHIYIYRSSSLVFSLAQICEFDTSGQIVRSIRSFPSIYHAEDLENGRVSFSGIIYPDPQMDMTFTVAHMKQHLIQHKRFDTLTFTAELHGWQPTIPSNRLGIDFELYSSTGTLLDVNGTSVIASYGDALAKFEYQPHHYPRRYNHYSESDSSPSDSPFQVEHLMVNTSRVTTRYTFSLPPSGESEIQLNGYFIITYLGETNAQNVPEITRNVDDAIILNSNDKDSNFTASNSTNPSDDPDTSGIDGAHGKSESKLIHHLSFCFSYLSM